MQKAIKIFDLRAPQNPIFQLTGHLDYVRSIIMSNDGKTLLSGSSDSTVKEWSLSMAQVPTLTYSHFSDSVWSLCGSENLDTFWTGTRQGYIWKTLRSSSGEGGDSILVGKDDGPIFKVVKDIHLHI